MLTKIFFIIFLILSVGETLKKKEGQSLQIYYYIIVGAGISGLTAAEVLLNHDKKILMLEGQERIGGKVLSLKLKDIPALQQKKWFQQKLPILPDLALNLGASEIQHFEPSILKICKRENYELRDIIKEGRDILFYKSQRFDAAQFAQNDAQFTAQFKRVFEQLQKDQKIYNKILDDQSLLIFPKYKQQFQRYDNTSAKDYFNSLNIKSKLLMEMLLNKIEVINAVQPELVNIGFIASGLEFNYHELIETFGFKPRRKMKEILGGSQRVIKMIADRIEKNGNKIADFCKFNYKVTKIDNTGDVIKVYAKRANQKDSPTMIFLTKKVVNAMGVAANKNVQIAKISKAKRIYIDRSIISELTKVFVMTPKPFDVPGLTETITLGWENEYASMMRNYSPDSKLYGNYLFYIAKPQIERWQKISQKQKNQYLWNIIINAYQLNQSSSEVKYMKSESVIFEYSICNNEFFVSAAGIAEPTGIYRDILQSGAKIRNFKDNQFGIAYVCSQLSDETPFYMEGGIKNARRRVMEMLEEQESSSSDE